jgi:hypothetical protein
MVFKWAYNENGAPLTHLSDIYGTAAEAFVEGEALKLVSGRWTKATNGVAVAGFCNQTVTAGANTLVDVIQAKEGDVFEASYTGTPDATFLPGATTVDVAADGLSVLASDVTGGAFSILGVNTTKATCRLKVKNRQLS